MCRPQVDDDFLLLHNVIENATKWWDNTEVEGKYLQVFTIIIKTIELIRQLYQYVEWFTFWVTTSAVVVRHWKGEVVSERWWYIQSGQNGPFVKQLNVFFGLSLIILRKSGVIFGGYGQHDFFYSRS